MHFPASYVSWSRNCMFFLSTKIKDAAILAAILVDWSCENSQRKSTDQEVGCQETDFQNRTWLTNLDAFFFRSLENLATKNPWDFLPQNPCLEGRLERSLGKSEMSWNVVSCEARGGWSDQKSSKNARCMQMLLRSLFVLRKPTFK